MRLSSNHYLSTKTLLQYITVQNVHYCAMGHVGAVYFDRRVLANIDLYFLSQNFYGAEEFKGWNPPTTPKFLEQKLPLYLVKKVG